MHHPQIQVILGDDTIPAGLQGALARLGAATGFWPLREAARFRPSARTDAYVIAAPADLKQAMPLIKETLERLAERPRAVLVLRAGGAPMPRVAHPTTLPVTFVGELDEAELTVRLRTMLEMRSSLDSLHLACQTSRRQGETAARRFAHQLRLASRVQRELLPTTLPRYGDVSFSVLYRSVDYVSGDIYDIHTLDDEHVGIAIADAAGHGIPAALLTVFIRRALRGVQPSALRPASTGAPAHLTPDEVLMRLNAELLEAGLPDCQFVAASYAILNTRTHVLQLARGGTPYPLLRRSDGSIQQMHADGAVLGILPDARSEVLTLQLSPGDALLLYTDGFECLLGGSAPALDANLARRAIGTTLRPAIAAGAATSSTRSAARAASFAISPARAAAASPHREAHAARGVAHASWVTGPDRDGLFDGALPPADASRQDGLGAIRAGFRPAAGHGSPAPSRTRPTRTNGTLHWENLLTTHGPDAMLERLSHRYDTLRRIGHELDDLTMLCIKVAQRNECAA